jgi:hypothetical protein
MFSDSASPRDEDPRPPKELSGEPIELRDYFLVFAEPGGDLASCERKLAICWCTELPDGTLVTHQTSPVRSFWRTTVACEDAVYELVEPIPERVAYCRCHHINWHPDDPLQIDWGGERLPIYDPFATSDPVSELADGIAEGLLTHLMRKNQAKDEAPYLTLTHAVAAAIRQLLRRENPPDAPVI